MIFRRQFVYPPEKQVISRLSLYWFLAAMAVATALPFTRLPLWLAGLVGCLLIWRIVLSLSGDATSTLA